MSSASASSLRWRLRDGHARDLAAFEQALYHAFHWRRGECGPGLDVFRANTDFRAWTEGFGARRGDRGVIAEDAADGAAIGAAWSRYWRPEACSYGFVAEDVPELAIGVAPQCRSHGVGRALMKALLAKAWESGASRISLSVDPDNFARLLYESLGFRRVGESGTSVTLVCNAP